MPAGGEAAGVPSFDPGAGPTELRPARGSEALAQTSEPTAGDGRSAEATPPTLWTYWDQGAAALPAFNKLCVETWSAAHPQLRLEVVGPERLDEFLEPGDLPATFGSLDLCQHRADCVKLALLLRHGGIYVDSSVLLWGDLLGAVGWQDIEAGRVDFAGFYLGTPAHVENWCMACRRSCRLVELWHREHLRYWETRTRAGNVTTDAFFQGADLGHIRPDERSYLVQHAVYKKLLDLDTGGFRALAGRVHLRSAESLLFGRHVFRTARDRQMDAAATWRMLMLEDNEVLAKRIRLAKPPLMKFTGHFAFLQWCEREEFLVRKNTMRRFFRPRFLD